MYLPFLTGLTKIFTVTSWSTLSVPRLQVTVRSRFPQIPGLCLLVLALTNFTLLGSRSFITTPRAVAPRSLITLMTKVCLAPTRTDLGLTV